MRDLLSIEVPITLNAALCQRHRAKCPASKQLETVCTEAEEYEEEFDTLLGDLIDSLPDGCVDFHKKCPQWAKVGECTRNAGYMLTTCRMSCHDCVPHEHQDKETNDALERAFEEDEKEIQKQEEQQKKRTTINLQLRNGANDPAQQIQRQQEQIQRQQEQIQRQQEQLQQLQEQQKKQREKQQQKLQEQQQKQQQQQQDTNNNNNNNNDNKIRVIADESEEESLNMEHILETKIIPELKARCTKYPSWTASQVERCLSFAEDGIEYDPRLFDIDDDDDDDSFWKLSGEDDILWNGNKSNGGGWLTRGRIFFLLVIAGLVAYNKLPGKTFILNKFPLKKKEYHLG